MIFIKRVINFEVFAVLTCDVILLLFLWPLGASWGPLGPPLGGLWGPSGASWGRLGGDFGASLGILEGFLGALAPKMPPRAPKTPPGGLPDTPGGLPEAPLRRPRGLPEAPETGHCRCHVLCFHQGQAECAKRSNKISLSQTMFHYSTIALRSQIER